MLQANLGSADCKYSVCVSTLVGCAPRARDLPFESLQFLLLWHLRTGEEGLYAFVDLQCKQVQIGLAYRLPPFQVLIEKCCGSPGFGVSPIGMHVGGFPRA